LGRALAELEDESKGLVLMHASLAAQTEMRSEISRTHYLALVAEVLAKMGRITDAEAILDEAFEILNRTGERFFEAELYRIKGALLLKSGAENDAEANFRQSIEVARQQQVKSLELRATTSLCRLLASQNKPREARLMLTDIYEWF